MTMAVKHFASVVKAGVVPFLGLKVLMQTQARDLLIALNSITVLVNVDDQIVPREVIQQGTFKIIKYEWIIISIMCDQL